MNEQQRRQEEQARQMRSFAAAFAQGQAKPLDRFGNEFAAGDKIMVRFAIDPVIDIVSVNPVLDHRAEPGMIDLMCTVTFPLRVKSGVPFQNASIVARRMDKPVEQSTNGQGSSLSLVPGQRSADADAADLPPTDDPNKIVV